MAKEEGSDNTELSPGEKATSTLPLAPPLLLQTHLKPSDSFSPAPWPLGLAKKALATLELFCLCGQEVGEEPCWTAFERLHGARRDSTARYRGIPVPVSSEATLP